MSILGFQLPGSLAPGASKIASGLGGKAASAGMFANPVGLALAGGQLAFGIANMIQGQRAQEEAYGQQVYRTTLANSMAQMRADAANRMQAEAFGAKLDFVKRQITNNFLSAMSASTAEQMRLAETFDAAAYRSQAMQKMLKEAIGSAGAREVYGKSARRGALVSTLGAYGRTRAQQADQLMSETTASQMRMDTVFRQMRAANAQAKAQVAILPTAQYAAMQAMPTMSGGGGLSTALQIGQIGMSAFQTGLRNTPKEMKFLGIQGQMGRA